MVKTLSTVICLVTIRILDKSCVFYKLYYLLKAHDRFILNMVKTEKHIPFKRVKFQLTEISIYQSYKKWQCFKLA